MTMQGASNSKRRRTTATIRRTGFFPTNVNGNHNNRLHNPTPVNVQLMDQDVSNTTNNMRPLRSSPRPTPGPSRMNNNNQTNTNPVFTPAHSITNRNQPMSRKQRKTKTTQELMQALRNRVDTQLRFPSLSQMINIEDTMDWWFCQICRNKGIKACGVNVCKKCETRRIVEHCVTAHHVASLSIHQKALNEERIRLNNIDKINKEKANSRQANARQANAINVSNVSNVSATISPTSPVSVTAITVASILKQNNQYHRNIITMMRHLDMSESDFTLEHLQFLNYLNTIHRGIKKLESVRQIIDRLKSELEHGADITSHYLSESDIQTAIQCLSEAQKELDDELLQSNSHFSISEDGNSLRGLGARGYFIKLFDNHTLIELFATLKETAKSLEISYSGLQTIDSGLDGYRSLFEFIKSDLKRDPNDVISIATDASGSNIGTPGNGKACREIFLYRYPFCIWNWDDQHKGSRISSKLKKQKNFTILQSLCHAIRKDLMESPINLRLYQKYLNSINVAFEKYSKDIDIRFNSILPLLTQIAENWAVLYSYYCELVTMKKECIQYERQPAIYRQKNEHYQRFIQQQRSQQSHEVHRNQIIGLNPRTVQKPVAPSIPRQVALKRDIAHIAKLLLINLFIDYLELFDRNFTKTGSVNWLKCLTLSQIESIEVKLNAWKGQSYSRPVSPHLMKLIECLSYQGDNLIYRTPIGTINFNKVNVDRMSGCIIKQNEALYDLFIKLLLEYYPPTQRAWMKACMDLIDPTYYHRKDPILLQTYGIHQITLLLKHYGKSKNIDGRIHTPLSADPRAVINEYNEWKKKTNEMTWNFMEISDGYLRCTGFYAKSAQDYGRHYPRWHRLWSLILLDYNQSMSLERLFRVRKLIQTETCSSYTVDGLTRRLRVYQNSVSPSTVASIKLYFIAWKYWDAKTDVRGRIFSPKAPAMNTNNMN
eukprot:107735_1